MKNNMTENNDDQLPEEMADIKSGEVFKVPETYFEDLRSKLFDENGRYIDPHRPGKTIRMIHPWMIAASLALIAILAWWFWSVPSTPTEFIANEELLEEYLEIVALEYDMETLIENLEEEDILTLNKELSATYENYINENIDQFYELLYE